MVRLSHNGSQVLAYQDQLCAQQCTKSPERVKEWRILLLVKFMEKEVEVDKEMPLMAFVDDRV
jgi:hypothetical protein